MSKDLRIINNKFIDQTTRISFKFDDKTLYGFKGDTLASALLANNIHLVGRSFKYHRPRGIIALGSEEPNQGSSKALGEGALWYSIVKRALPTIKHAVDEWVLGWYMQTSVHNKISHMETRPREIASHVMYNMEDLDDRIEEGLVDLLVSPEILTQLVMADIFANARKHLEPDAFVMLKQKM